MKNKYPIILICIAVFVFVVWRLFSPTQLPQTSQSNTSIQTVTPTVVQNIPLVTVRINDGQKIASYTGIPAMHAYGALIAVTDKEKIPMMSKTYDFGVFVSELAGKKSGSDMSWIYYVNGISGEVAANKATVSVGDIVEWRYEKPSM